MACETQARKHRSLCAGRVRAARSLRLQVVDQARPGEAPDGRQIFGGTDVRLGICGLRRRRVDVGEGPNRIGTRPFR